MKFGSQVRCFLYKHRAAICSFLLNFCIFILVTSAKDLRFETNDDRDVSNLLADVYGTGMGTYIPFINLIFCEAVSFLFRILGTAYNWYAILLIALGFLSLVAICYLLLQRAKNIYFGLLLSVFLLLTVYEDYYVRFQFTHYAVLCCSAGCLGLADSLYGKENFRVSRVIFDVLLFVTGSMIRFQAVFFVLPFGGILLLYRLFWQDRNHPVFEKIRFHKWPLTAVFAMLCLTILTRGFHLYTYTTDKTLQEFNMFNKLRVELLDYGLPDYEKNNEEFGLPGITASDLECLDNQIFLDTDIFSMEVFEKLVDKKEQRNGMLQVGNFSRTGLKKVFDYIRNDFFLHPHWSMMLLLLLLYLLCVKKENLFGLIFGIIFIIAGMWYFLSVDRMPYRIWCSLITPPLIFGFYFLAQDYYCTRMEPDITVLKMSQFCRVVCLSSMLLIQLGWLSKDLWHTSEDPATDNYENIILFAEEHPDSLILVDRPTVSPLTYHSTVGVLEVPEQGSHRNICYQGGWICRTPANMSVLEKYEEKNPYKAIAEGETVYLIDAQSADKILNFIWRHYGTNVEMTIETYIGESEIPVYRFYSHKGQTE